jgi:O-antigen ligase
MIPVSLNNSTITKILIFLFPFLLLRHENYGFICLLLLGFFGLSGFYEAITKKKFNLNITNFRYVFITFYSFLIFIISSHIFYDHKINELPITRFEIILALAPFISFAIMTSDITLKALTNAIKLALVLAGIYVLFKSLGQTNITDRVLWPSWIGVLLFTFSLINVSNKRKNISTFAIDLIYYYVVLYAIIECGTRVPIISLAVLIPITFFLNRYLIDNKNRNRNLIDFVIVSLVLILCFFSSTNNLHRFSEITNELKTPQQDNKQFNLSRSYDQRKLLIHSGLQAFHEKPYLGHGYQNTNTSIIKYYPEEIKKTYLINMTHVHNSYINILVQGGILGLISYIFIFCLIPFFIFLKAFIKEKRNYYSALGMLLITGYCIFGIGDTMYLGLREIPFFIFFLSFFLKK